MNFPAINNEWLDWVLTAPVMIMIAAALPVVLLGWLARTFPSRRLVLLALVPTLLTGLMLLLPQLFLAIAIIDVALWLVAAIDLLSVPRAAMFTAERDAGRIASLRKDHRVTLTISNHAQREHRIEIRDDVPQALDATPEQFALKLAARSRAVVHYDLQAGQRGAFQLHCVRFRVRSRLGLWWRYFQREVETTIHVYPDMKQLAEFELLARTNRLSLMGLRRTRKIGQDNEFERLRDFTRDDNPKHIDWRTTARRNKLTVKDFQASQSQRLMFLIDCGRMMTNQAAGLSLLDHALNSMLMLSYVALRRGDSVGLICFSDTIHTYVPPKSGSGQLNRLLHASFDRFPRLVESRYDQAFLHLASVCRKRSLVMLMTNVIDEVNSNQIEQYLGHIVGRHLPLGILMRDRQMFDAVEPENPTGSALYRAAAAADILHWRHQILGDLERRGVLSLDVFPEDMTAPLINKYIEVKARHLL